MISGKQHGLLLLCGLLLLPVARADWPQWRGPGRDGLSPDTGLLRKWPDAGPKQLWQVTGLGGGYSSPAISGGLLYVTGMIDEKLVISAFDLQGQRKWTTIHGPAWNTSYPGTRATVTVDRGQLYLMSGPGLLACYDAATGKRSWQVDITRTHGGKPPQWGYSESVLIHGRLAIVQPGGASCIVAFDKTTGKQVWVSQGLDDPPAYASAIVVTYQKLEMIVTLTSKGMVCVRASDGAFLWRNDRAASGGQVCPTPVYSDGLVFAAASGQGGACVKLTVTGDRVTASEIWKTKKMQTHHGGFLLVGGFIYGNHKRGWSCLDFKTGKQRWFGRGVRKGSLTYADGMLYTLSERGGKIGLVRATPEKFELISSFKVPGDGKSWAHPVVIGKRLYVRYGDKLTVYDVTR
ncbi:PQQ-like beta-propeller repeat protein [bacterium AH-315-M10]|nr:PQQ-like beta-propeller repeat protein [bacterium AH-315-M10]